MSVSSNIAFPWSSGPGSSVGSSRPIGIDFSSNGSGYTGGSYGTSQTDSVVNSMVAPSVRYLQDNSTYNPFQRQNTSQSHSSIPQGLYVTPSVSNNSFRDTLNSNNSSNSSNTVPNSIFGSSSGVNSSQSQQSAQSNGQSMRCFQSTTTGEKIWVEADSEFARKLESQAPPGYNAGSTNINTNQSGSAHSFNYCQPIDNRFSRSSLAPPPSSSVDLTAALASVVLSCAKSSGIDPASLKPLQTFLDQYSQSGHQWQSSAPRQNSATGTFISNLTGNTNVNTGAPPSSHSGAFSSNRGTSINNSATAARHSLASSAAGRAYEPSSLDQDCPSLARSERHLDVHESLTKSIISASGGESRVSDAEYRSINRWADSVCTDDDGRLLIDDPRATAGFLDAMQSELGWKGAKGQYDDWKRAGGNERKVGAKWDIRAPS